MFSVLSRYCEKRRASASAQQAVSQSSAQAILPTALILDALNAGKREGRVFQIRDLHKITPLRQADALRAIKSLEDTGTISLRGGEFDPLSAIITLK